MRVPLRLLARCLLHVEQARVTRQRNPVPFRGGPAGLSGKTHAVGESDADGDDENDLDRMLSMLWRGSIPRKAVSPRQPLEVKAVTEYEKIYQFDNLYRAYRMAARSKRHKPDVIEFELNLADNLWRLHDELESKSYKPSPYHHFTIFDPKTRDIQALAFPDRVVQRSLCDNALRPWFENRLIYDCAACREGKGTHFAMDRLSEFLREFYRQYGAAGYILKCDVRKYFDSVDHEVLKWQLRRYPDPEVRCFLYQIIDGYHADTGKGLPMGNQSSQWFALYYLDGIDRIIKEKYRIQWYSRYMDDLVLLHPDKETLKRCLAELREYAADRLKLEFNEKTQIFPLSQGVDYLGWHFYLTDTGKVIRRLRTANKRRFKRRLKRFQWEYASGLTDFDAIKRSLASYKGHLQHGHTWKLRKEVYRRFVLVRSGVNNKAKRMKTS